MGTNAQPPKKFATWHRFQRPFLATEATHEYSNVTTLHYGNQFHDQDWANPKVMRLLAENR